MSGSDEEEFLYDWYINSYFRKTCPKCGSQDIKEVDYTHDKNGQGTIYRCQKCFYLYGIEDESNQAYFDKNSNPTLYWK